MSVDKKILDAVTAIEIGLEDIKANPGKYKAIEEVFGNIEAIAFAAGNVASEPTTKKKSRKLLNQA